MLITMPRKSLAQILAMVGRFVPARTTLPILKAVNVSYQNGQAIFMASDIETTCRVSVPSDPFEGSWNIPHDRLLAVASRLPEGTVSLAGSGGTVVVSSGKSKLTLPTMDGVFPECPELSDGVSVVVPGKVLGRMFTLGPSPVVSKESSHNGLTGVLFELFDGAIAAIASNTVMFGRFFWNTIPTDSNAGMIGQAVIRPDALGNAAKYIPKTGDVSLQVGETHALFSFDSTGIVLAEPGEEEEAKGSPVGVQIVTRTIQAPFPNWRRLFSERGNYTAIVETAELTQAIGRAAIVASADASRVNLTYSEEGLRVGAKSSEGEYEDLVQAEMGGRNINEPMTTSVSTRTSALFSFCTSGVKMAQDEEERAIYIEETTKEDGLQFSGLIQPMKTV